MPMIKELTTEDLLYNARENNKKLKQEIKKYRQAFEEIREIINEQKSPLDKAISQSEFTLERLCVYEEKYIKVVDKINEALNDN